MSVRDISYLSDFLSEVLKSNRKSSDFIYLFFSVSLFLVIPHYFKREDSNMMDQSIGFAQAHDRLCLKIKFKKNGGISVRFVHSRWNLQTSVGFVHIQWNLQIRWIVR